jgi:predicted PurR-regulated permease PerM
VANAGFGFIIGLGLHLIGLPYAALWGAVAALFRIVPYVGTITAAAGLTPSQETYILTLGGWK